MVRLPLPGSDDGVWGDLLNEFLLVEHNADGSLKAKSNDTTYTGKTKFKASTEATDAFQVLDGEDTPILNIDTQNRRVGIGTATPAHKLAVNEGNIAAFGAADQYVAVGADDNNSMLMRWSNTNTNGRIETWVGGTRAGNLLLQPNAGNVGVGTTSPQRKLQVTSGSGESGTQLALHRTDGVATSSVISFRLDTTGAGATSFVESANITASHQNVGHSTRNTSLGFFTSSSGAQSEKLRIQGDGKVGIGTTEPGAPLDVQSATAVIATTLRVSNTNASGGNYLQLDRATNSRVNALLFSTAGTEDWSMGVLRNAGNPTQVFSLSYNSTGNINSTGLAVTTGGNVGIGTTNPGNKLDIAGNTGGSLLMVRQTDANAAYITLNPVNGTNNSRILANWTTGNGYLGLGAGTNDQVVINQSGNVGIGTTAPASRLHIHSPGGDLMLGSGTGETHSVFITHKGSYDNEGRIEFYQGSTTWGNNGLKFYGQDGDGNSVEVLRLAGKTGAGNKPDIAMVMNGGNVGIGTITPGSKKLYVDGSGQFNGTLDINTGSASTPTSAIVFSNTNGTHGTIAIAPGLDISSGASASLQIRQTSASWPILLATNGVNRVLVGSTGNIGFNTTDQFGSGAGVLGIANATTAPTTNPTGGGVLYSEGGLLKWRRSSGTVDVVGASASPANGFASVATLESTSSTSFVDLTTPGPVVTIVTGTKARVEITVTSQNDTSLGVCRVGVAVSGATTRAAAVDKALHWQNATTFQQARFTTVVHLTGLTPGTNTFTLKYTVNTGTGDFFNREIYVQDEGS